VLTRRHRVASETSRDGRRAYGIDLARSLYGKYPRALRFCLHPPCPRSRSPVADHHSPCPASPWLCYCHPFTPRISTSLACCCSLLFGNSTFGGPRISQCAVNCGVYCDFFRVGWFRVACAASDNGPPPICREGFVLQPREGRRRAEGDLEGFGFVCGLETSRMCSA